MRILFSLVLYGDFVWKNKLFLPPPVYIYCSFEFERIENQNLGTSYLSLYLIPRHKNLPTVRHNHINWLWRRPFFGAYTQGRMLRKQPNFSRSVFLTFTIYFVSEQGNRFGAKVISLGYLGYLNFQTPIFSSFSNF